MDLMQIWDGLQQAAPYIVAILAATTALAGAMRSAARAFDRYARSTPSPDDDRIARRLVRFADGFAAAMETLERFLPRVGFGSRR